MEYAVATQTPRVCVCMDGAADDGESEARAASCGAAAASAELRRAAKKVSGVTPAEQHTIAQVSAEKEHGQHTQLFIKQSSVSIAFYVRNVKFSVAYSTHWSNALLSFCAGLRYNRDEKP